MAQDLPKLDTPCERCGGAGTVSGWDCRACRGKGYVLTETGNALLAFILRHVLMPPNKLR